jgi:hypothetical protein
VSFVQALAEKRSVGVLASSCLILQGREYLLLCQS